MIYFLSLIFVLNGHIYLLESQISSKGVCEDLGFDAIATLALSSKVDVVDYTCQPTYPDKDDDILKRIKLGEF